MKGISHYYELVMSFIFGATRSQERFSDRDGLLSYATEWHAAIIGLFTALSLGLPGLALIVVTALGLKRWKQISNRKAVKELRKEPWYGIGAGGVGYLGNHFLGLPNVGEVLLMILF